MKQPASKNSPFYFFFFMAPVFIVFIGTAGLILSVKMQSYAEKHKPLPVFGTVSPFYLTDQNGRDFSSDSLKDKVWITDFIFTRCAGPCPLMSQAMKKIQAQFKTDSPIQFVSFTVDPAHDTPQVLSEYASLHSADLTNWTFLTGPQEMIYDLSIKQFHLGASEESIPKPLGESDTLVLHSTKFVLLDSSGNIRGYYDSSEPKAMSQVVHDAFRLMNEIPKPS